MRDPTLTSPLTGRITGTPSRLWHTEVLAPQFDHDVSQLLRWHVLVEKVLLIEYRRMGLVEVDDTAAIARCLDEVNAGSLVNARDFSQIPALSCGSASTR